MMKITKVSVLILTVVMMACSEDKATQEKKAEIKRETIETIMEEYKECEAQAESNNDCKSFTARAICEYYGIDDLKKEGNYVDYHDIYDFVTTDDSWKNLGMATDQEALDNAQRMANEGFAVVAIDTEDKHKLAIMIIEGEQKKSGSWGLNAPNCAAFFPASGPEPYVNKTLNYAFSQPDGIQLWVKK